MKNASFLERSSALAIDLAAFYLSARIAGFNHGELVILWVLYETVLVSQWGGSTIGKRKMGIRVTSLSKRPVTPAKALVRSLGKIFSTAVFLLGDLWMLKAKRSQAWHDKMAGTLVVQNVQ